MLVVFDKEYLKSLYVEGKCDDKKHWFQPEIVSKYVRVIKLMCSVKDVSDLIVYKSLHYERLKGNKQGLSSVRVNNKYRIEFEEWYEEGETIATICNITELSNHYD